MITTARFKNFRLLKDVSIDLGRLNVLVGRNGVGKSTALEALYRLFLVSDHPQGLYHGWERGVGFAELSVRLDSKRNAFQVSRTEHAATLSDVETDAAWLRLSAERIAADHYSESDAPELDRDGSGLATVVQYLQGLRDGRLEAIEGDLARVVPGVRRIRALPTRIERLEKVSVTVDGHQSWLDQRRELTGARFEVEMEGQGWIRADQLSEGTLLALGLLTELRCGPPRLILLDDLDKGLHPVAQRAMVRLVRTVLETNPDVQIVATSHSPFVLDELDASEAFIVGAVDSTSSKIVRLDRHPAWEKRKGYLHPGEFWSAVGEGWVGESSK
jgi:predicted ATPase